MQVETHAPGPPLLRARALRLYHGALCAVDGLDLQLDAGQCLGLLGPNGAGKSSTLAMLQGLRSPDDGEVHFAGRALDRHYRSRCGIMFQHTALPDYLSVGETLKLFSRLYPRSWPLETLIDTCALGDFLTRDVHQLSGGQRQRLLLAIALVNDPDILFLDEPTTGLDPRARQALWQTLQECKRRGKAIVLATHYMHEAEALCDWLVILRAGRIIAEGPPQRLLRQSSDELVLQLEVSQARLLELLQPLGARALIQQDAVLLPSAHLPPALQRLTQAGLDLQSLRVRALDLEALYLRLTGEEVSCI